MRLTNSLSKTTSTFKLIEEAVNKLRIAASADEAEDTATFLFRKMDAEAASFERDTTFKRVARSLRTELENRDVRCSVYRFHEGQSFGGYTFVLSNLLENDQAIGTAYVHLVADEDQFRVAASLLYKSPLKVKKAALLPQTNVARVWDVLSHLGYDKPTSNILELDIQSFVEREDEIGASKCVDLREGASFAIADRIRKTLARDYQTARVMESNNRYTVIATEPKGAKSKAKRSA